MILAILMMIFIHLYFSKECPVGGGGRGGGSKPILLTSLKTVDISTNIYVYGYLYM